MRFYVYIYADRVNRDLLHLPLRYCAVEMTVVVDVFVVVVVVVVIVVIINVVIIIIIIT